MADPTPAPVARVLPAAEWATTLVGTDLEQQPLDPEHSIVVVVEQDGHVVACWAAMTTVHVEGLWQHPDHRNAGVSRALLTTMVAELLQRGVLEVLTQSVTPDIDALLEHVGARKVPGQTWVLPLAEVT